jgi:hypothetical protein
LDQALEFIFSNSMKWHMERQVTLQPDYEKVKYNPQQHFVMSKVGFNHELNNASISRLKKTQLLSVPDHER